MINQPIETDDPVDKLIDMFPDVVRLAANSRLTPIQVVSSLSKTLGFDDPQRQRVGNALQHYLWDHREELPWRIVIKPANRD